MRLHAPIRLVAATCAVLLVVGCGAPRADTAAVVNGDPIPADVVERLLDAQLSSGVLDVTGLPADQRTQTIGDRQRQVLSSLIRIEVVRQLAAEQGIEISQEQIDERLASEAEAQGGQEALEGLVAQSGLTMDDFADLIIADLARQEALAEALGGGEVTEEDLRAAYEQGAEQGRYEQASVRHILVESEQEANQLLERLEEGGDFAELARARSTDPGSAERGGDLGTAPISGYVEPFAEAVRGAEPGEVVGPVETEFGFHIIEVTEFVEPSFDDVRDQLEQELTAAAGGQEQLNQLVVGALAEAEVTVGSRFGTWNPQAGQVVATDLLLDGGAPAQPSAPPTPDAGVETPQ